MNRLQMILVGVALAVLFLFVSNLDWQDQQQMAKAVPMDREAAHKKAVRLREQGLLDDANNLGYPVARLPPEEK